MSSEQAPPATATASSPPAEARRSLSSRPPSATQTGAHRAIADAGDAQGAGTGERRRLSELPPAQSAARLASQLLDGEDLKFVETLRGAGLCDELEGDELLRVATVIGDAEGLDRRIDVLEAYYDAGGDRGLGEARRVRDRFFLQRATEPVTAARLVERLREITPELGAVALERIGGGEDGPLVLRAGEHFAALLDDYEETLDTDEIDLREIEERRREGNVTMVTVRGLVRAVNALLDRHGVRQRMIALRSDEAREVYVATSVTEAIELARAGWLEDDDVEDVMELAGW